MPICLDIKFPDYNSQPNRDTNINKLHWNDKYKQKYVENLTTLSSNIDLQSDIHIDYLIEKTVAKVRHSAVRTPNKPFFEPKQQWFDWSCERHRRNMIKCLKEFRKNHTVATKTLYLVSKTKYMDICSSKKLAFYNNNIQKLNHVKCSSDWWKLSNMMKTCKHSIKGNLNADDFHKYFSSLLQISENEPLMWSMPYLVDPILDSPIEMIELKNVLVNLKANKAPGQDGIPFEYYKHAPTCFLEELLTMYNKIFLHETIPSSFCKSLLIPLFKKGDPNDSSNYRGLSLIDTICKIFYSILLNRITEWIEQYNVLNEFQAGFRKNYSTTDNIFNFVNIVSLNKHKGKNTYAFFVDFSCAFDMIPRNSLFYKLSCLGLSSKIIRILQNSYTNTSSRVWDGNSISEPFVSDVGVKQGCILSPLLFSLYVNDLVDNLPGGVNVANTTIKILLYADDIVLLSDSPSELQSMIDALRRYCAKWCLKVNLNKSKIMIMRTGTRIPSNLNWRYGDEEIEIVNIYKYLGFDITFNLSYNTYLQNKLSTSKLAINTTWSKYINNPGISKTNKIKIFHAASRSIMCYAAQVWGYQKYDVVEKLFRFFIKKMLHLPSTIPNYMLNLETGLDSMYTFTLKLHFCYINKVLNMSSERLPRILAMAVISHNMFWAKEWSNLCQKIDYIPPTDQPLCTQWKHIIHLLEIKERVDNIQKALNSQHHDLYSKLNYNVTPALDSNFSSRATSLLIKARGGLLELNGRSFSNQTSNICTICNLNQVENTFHFLGICPIFNQIRKTFFGSNCLSFNEVVSILNGSNFYALYKYIELSLKYRRLIINEFDV